MAWCMGDKCVLLVKFYKNFVKECQDIRCEQVGFVVIDILVR